MKSEGIIMGEARVGEGIIMNNANVEKTPVKIEDNKKTNELPIGKDRGRTVQKPETSKQEAVVGVEKKFINLKPETEERLKGFGVGVDNNDGKREDKTALDAVVEINKSLDNMLPVEQRDKAFFTSVDLMNKLTKKYGVDTEEGRNFRSILFNDVFGDGNVDKGQKIREWFQSQANVTKEGEKMHADVNRLAEILDLELNQQELAELQGLFTIPAPIGTEKVGMGGVSSVPAPYEMGKEGASETPEILKTSAVKSKDEEGKMLDKFKKAWSEFFKKKWVMRGLIATEFLIILYLSAMGYYAQAIENVGQRSGTARGI